MAVGPEGARIARADDTERVIELAGQYLAELAGARGGAALAHALDGTLRPAALKHVIVGSDACALVVGTYDGAVVGLALVEHPPDVGRSGSPQDRPAKVCALYVEPAMRGVGVGEAVFAEILSLEAARGATALDAPALPGDGASKSFLEDIGFRARLLIMRRSLDSGSGP
jgi:ribosomal protein S18 acetylase RimI-like enzyme